MPISIDQKEVHHIDRSEVLNQSVPSEPYNKPIPNVFHKFKCPNCKQGLIMHNDEETIVSSCDNFVKPTIYLYHDKNEGQKIVELCNSGLSHIAYDAIKNDIMLKEKVTVVLLIKAECYSEEYYCPMCNAVHQINDWIDVGQDTSETNCIICGAESSMNVSRNKIEYVCSKNNIHNIIIED